MCDACRRLVKVLVICAGLWFLLGGGDGASGAELAPGEQVGENAAAMQWPAASISGGVGSGGGVLDVGGDKSSMGAPVDPKELLQWAQPDAVEVTPSAVQSAEPSGAEHTPIVRPQPSGTTVKLVSVDDEGDVAWEVWGAGLLVGVAALVLAVLIVRGPGR